MERLPQDLVVQHLFGATLGLADVQLVWLVLSISIATTLAIVVRSDRWLRLYKYTWAAAGVALLLLTFVLGTEINGQRLTLSFGPVSGQPSELLKVILVVFLAGYLSENRPLLVEQIDADRADRRCRRCRISRRWSRCGRSPSGSSSSSGTSAPHCCSSPCSSCSCTRRPRGSATWSWACSCSSSAPSSCTSWFRTSGRGSTSGSIRLPRRRPTATRSSRRSTPSPAAGLSGRASGRACRRRSRRRIDGLPARRAR